MVGSEEAGSPPHAQTSSPAQVSTPVQAAVPTDHNRPKALHLGALNRDDIDSPMPAGPAHTPTAPDAPSPSSEFQFMVCASDFSPGPLMSPIHQRLLAEAPTDGMDSPWQSDAAHWNGEAEPGPIARLGLGKPSATRQPSNPDLTCLVPAMPQASVPPSNQRVPFLQVSSHRMFSDMAGNTAAAGPAAVGPAARPATAGMQATQGPASLDEWQPPSHEPSTETYTGWTCEPRGMTSWSGAQQPTSYDPNALLGGHVAEEDGEPFARGAYYHPTPPRHKLQQAASQHTQSVTVSRADSGIPASLSFRSGIPLASSSGGAITAHNSGGGHGLSDQGSQPLAAPPPQPAQYGLQSGESGLISLAPLTGDDVSLMGSGPQPWIHALHQQQAASTSRELWELLKLALPCIIITGSAQLIILVSQILAGHLGTLPLAAVALGNMLWLVGFYSIIGTCTALETLGAQAFGAGNKGRLVVWDLAAGISCTLLALPFAGALWNVDRLMSSLLNQEPIMCQAVMQYCRGLVPGLLPQVWAIVLSKHMQAQSQVVLPALATGSASVLYMFMAIRMHATLGLQGISLAASVARAFHCVAMVVAVLAYESHQGTVWCSGGTWLKAMARWRVARRSRTLKSFLTYGAPGCLGSALESAGWQVTTAMAAYLGTLQVAVHASALSLASLVVMCVPMAMALAANIRVARLLGSGQGNQAQLCARLVVITSSTTAIILGVLLYLSRSYIGWLFTSHDQAVVDLLSGIAPLVAVYQATAGLLGSTQGVLRGLGRQGTVVVHNALGLAAGTLLGAWLTWGPPNMALSGLWAGSIAGSAVTAIMNLLMMMMVEWHEAVQVARTMQVLRQGVRARQHMISRALQDEQGVDEGLVEALLAEAHQDPRPLHIIYQEYTGLDDMMPAHAGNGHDPWRGAGPLVAGTPQAGLPPLPPPRTGSTGSLTSLGHRGQGQGPGRGRSNNAG